MANAEHLEILKQEVKVWNEWKRENSRVGVFRPYESDDLNE
jgi:hypothetical protein